MPHGGRTPVVLVTLRRSPRSTLFPYRRSSDLLYLSADLAAHGVFSKPQTRHRDGDEDQRADREDRIISQRRAQRSEEHTSELQSRRDLVCRLLLEKQNVAPPVRLAAQQQPPAG